MLRLALAAALVLAAPVAGGAQQQTAAASQKVRVAVLSFNSFILGADSKELAETLRDMMLTEIAKQPQFQTVERELLDQALARRKEELKRPLSERETAEIASLLGADYYFTGGMTGDKDNIRLDLRVMNIETGEVPGSWKEKVRRDQFLQTVDRIGKELQTLKLKPRAVDVVIPVPAVFAYSRGLDYEKRGDKGKAATMYRKALEIFPDYAAARTALGRVN